MSGNLQATDFEAVRCMSVSLAEKLDAYHERLKIRDSHVANVYGDLIDLLVTADAGGEALQTGVKLPPFLLPDSDGRLTSSQELLGRGSLVVSFNRGHWCSFCRLELLSLSEIHSSVRRLGAEIVSITPQGAATMSQRRKTDGLPFAILADIDNGYALANGLMISLGDAVHGALKNNGVELAKFQGNSGMFVPIPATYIVGQDQTIRAAYVNPDFRERMPANDIFQALQSLVH